MNFFTLLSDINTKEINIKLNEDGTITIATVQKKELITPAEAVKQVLDEMLPTKEEPTPVVVKEKPIKEVKVNNLKVLQEYKATIKAEDNILDHQEKLEELLANLSEAELDKPLPKKVRIDLDIAIRKRDQIQAAKDKLHGTAPTVVPEEIKEIAEASPNVIIASVPGVEKEQSTEEIKEAPMTQDEIDEVMTVLNDDFPTEEVAEAIEEMVVEQIATPIISIVADEPTPIPMPVPAPLPPAPIYIPQVPVIVMTQDQYTYEQLSTAGWTDQQMIDNGYAKIEYQPSAIVPESIVPPVPTAPTGKLSYSFPKPFDADDAGGTGHGDDSYSDADSGL